LSKIIGLYWFTNDLRVHDNPLLSKAAAEVDELICLYCYPSVSPYLARYSQQAKWSEPKLQFLDASLHCLNLSLNALNQLLLVVDSHPYHAIKDLVYRLGVSHLYVDAVAGCDEQSIIDRLKAEFDALDVAQKELRTLFTLEQLPFELSALPDTFTQFRKQVEPLVVPLPISRVKRLPSLPDTHSLPGISLTHHGGSALFDGGEQAGLAHCRRYFSSACPSEYKETRNALDGLDYSTKFSPWLAHGCLSAKTIYAMLKRYERLNGANESTYWIYFELLWREYFYWYARRYRQQLFRFGGIRNQPPLTSFYAHRFQQWKKGQTPFAIVNACMHQLNQTGYMSNRGRQLVASCLIHELGLDWRYGAAYFESQLIDYDVASNWGNWQYLAGVGADPRGSRQFNLEKQTQMYDPYQEFIDRWQGRCDASSLDSVDMVDWPVLTGRRDPAAVGKP